MDAGAEESPFQSFPFYEPAQGSAHMERQRVRLRPEERNLGGWRGRLADLPSEAAVVAEVLLGGQQDGLPPHPADQRQRGH